MGEYCDEGGPCPSHKIPRETRTKMSCLEQNSIHSSIYHITEKIQSRSLSQKNLLLQSVHPPSNVDVSLL